jgi:hypothetical protein
MKRLERDLALFKTGITQSMINKAASYPITWKVTFRNHDMSYTHLISKAYESYIPFFKSIAANIPDLEFVINVYD